MGLWFELGFHPVGKGALLEMGPLVEKGRPDWEGYGRKLDRGPSPLSFMGEAAEAEAVKAAIKAATE